MKEMLRNLTKDMWNVPNCLTILRLVLVPCFIWAYHAGQKAAALVIFCVASLTDLLDGYLARKLNQITNFGKLFDPLADKLLVISALCLHALHGVFPWPAVAIVAGKELLMVAGGAYLLKQGIVVYANYYGKIATVAFMAALILEFFHAELAARGLPLDMIFLWISVALTLVALGVYATQSLKQLKEKRRG